MRWRYFDSQTGKEITPVTGQVRMRLLWHDTHGVEMKVYLNNAEYKVVGIEVYIREERIITDIEAFINASMNYEEIEATLIVDVYIKQCSKT